MPEKLFVIGIDGAGQLGVADEELDVLLSQSDAVVGSSRQLALLKDRSRVNLPEELNWNLGMDGLLREIAQRKGAVLVLASGDPGYFGIVRQLRTRFQDLDFEIHPVVSSISLAFARAGTNWEDAAVISAHGRSFQNVLVELVRLLDPRIPAHKLAVLCSPEHTPRTIAGLLRDAGAHFDRYLVCSDLGSVDELVVEQPLETICNSNYPHNSILLATSGQASEQASLSNFEPQRDFFHRGGKFTKPEVREVILSKLLPHASGPHTNLWDLGAGSGSVGLSALQRHPSLQVTFVDEDPLQVKLCEMNASSYPNAKVVMGQISDVIWDLPDPSAIFVGGGGIDVLELLKARLDRRTPIAASFASINRATQAADLLGNLMEIMLPVGIRLPDGSWRLEAENPVFVTWGILP